MNKSNRCSSNSVSILIICQHILYFLVVLNGLQLGNSAEQYNVNYKTAHIHAIRVEEVSKGVSYENGGISTFLTNERVSIHLFGHQLTSKTIVRFVAEGRVQGSPCDVRNNATETYNERLLGEKGLHEFKTGKPQFLQRTSNIYPFHHFVLDATPDGASGRIIITFPKSSSGTPLYMCTRESDTDTEVPWIHQGMDPWLTVKTLPTFLPLWAQSILIVVLLAISGLFAGLTLGLLALDRTDLKILSSTGSDKERKYAIQILPLRERGNFLLCSLVIGNVLVNSILTILLDDLTTGSLAVLFSTVGIVVFGEIIPQAVCFRNGLEIGAKTIWVTKSVMILTSPVSYMISVILDKILGEV